MIERSYSKDQKYAYQVLKTTIQADKKAIFNYLATTEGISSWFPQLSIEQTPDEQKILFDLGDGIFEKMSLLDFKTDEFIAFEWASGQVAFRLQEDGAHTELVLKETLPLDFRAIPEDFTGWLVQMNNIKSVVEAGTNAPLDQQEMKKVRAEIAEALLAE